MPIKGTTSKKSIRKTPTTKLKDEINKYTNLIIVRSLSKSWALAGLRIGFILSSKKNINYMKSYTKELMKKN